MRQFYKEIIITTNGIDLYEFTEAAYNWINEIKANEGMLNISILHTSASILIQENADKDVLKDLKNFYIDLIPFNAKYNHKSEGEDDMPAHIKTSLTNTNITLSVINKKIIIGAWQGFFLFEHRYDKKKRKIFFHFLGE